MSYKGIQDLLKSETPKTREEERQDDVPVVIQDKILEVEGVSVKDVSNEVPVEEELEVVDDEIVKVAKPHSKFVSEKDQLYAQKCRVTAVDKSVRVEQGEFAVLRKSNSVSAPPIGTHHVTPCIVICVTSNNYFGMAHFDSYRTPGSLEEFLKKFKNDGTIKIQIYGGKEGSDPLRSGGENKKAVLEYIGLHYSDAEVEVVAPPDGPMDLVLEQDGSVKLKSFAVGIGVDEELGALMRLRHNIGGMVTAQQSRSQNFMPLHFVEAYQGGEEPIFIDRLALNALKQFDPSPIEGEEGVWATDPGGGVLGLEMRLAHPTVAFEINTQKLYMDSVLEDLVENESLRRKLIDISPIYIGPNAEAENLKIVKILGGLCSSERDADVVIKKALLLFNKASPYPLVESLIPEIEKAYKLKKDSLREALITKFGDISSLAHGVDVIGPDVVKIINDMRQEANPGLVLAQNIKQNVGDTTTLLTSLSKFYTIDGQELLTEVTKQFNKELAKDENIDKIISTLDKKNPVSKGNVLQVLKNHYKGTPLRVIEKKFDNFWDSAKDPKAALAEIIYKFQPDTPFDAFKEYNELAAAFHSAHLQSRQAKELADISFEGEKSATEKVIDKILKDAIITVMSKNSTFEKDFAEEALTCGELTRAVRDSIPYKKDTTPQIEVSVETSLTL